MAHISEEMRHCIDECTRCHQICVETVTRCLQMGGRHAEANHVRLLLDCAAICQEASNFMLRGSEFYPQTCAVCAEVCERCAADCDQFPEDFMKRCAEACRRCAEACRAMSSPQRTLRAA